MGRRIRHGLLALALLAAVAAGVYLLWNRDRGYDVPAGQLGVFFLPVGNADATLLKAGDVEILIDGGNPGDGDAVAAAVTAACRDGKLELLIASHAHADHIGGLPAVFEAVEVVTVVDSGYEGEGAAWTAYRNARDREGAQVIPADRDLVLTLSDRLSVSLLEPLCLPGDTNDTSVVARVDYRDVRMLFTGDAEAAVEGALDPAQLDADLLKAPHHGSNTSSTAEFLQAVRPEIIVIPAGEENEYGHPHGGAVGRMEETGAALYVTWEDGVTLRTDGRVLRVITGQRYSSAG